MNIFDKVTVKSLKKNKIRTLVTIIGIMLSTALICAVTTSFASVRQYAINSMEYSEGKWQSCEKDADYSIFKKLKDSDKIRDMGILSYIGYADICSSNSYKPYLYISGFEEAEEGMLPVHLISGRMPKDKTEIIIPDHLSQNGDVDLKEGDTITLDIGDRKLDPVKLIKYEMSNASEVADNITSIKGQKLIQDNPFRAIDGEDGEVLSAEYLEIRDKREYVVVGIYKRSTNIEDYSAPGYTAFTVPDEYSNNTEFELYYRMNNPRELYEFKKENALEGMNHTTLLLFQGVSRYESFYGVILTLFCIVIGLIMFGSIMLIYNAFAISVSERTKQFGLLSSIGATKKQIRKMVRFEATALSIIGIPLGILLGIVGMWITFLAIGSKFSVFVGDSYPEGLRICISPVALIAAAVIAFVTIRISAWVPSKRATKVSAVEAIRQNIDIKQTKHVRSPKLIYKLFGLSGLLAHKYFKRNKKKYRATILSLFMSIVLFVSASAFTNYISNASSDAFNSASFDYSIYLTTNQIVNRGINHDDMLKTIRNIDHISDVSYLFRAMQDVYISEDDIESKALQVIINNYQVEQSEDSVNEREGYKTLYMPILFIDDGTYVDMLHQYGLSEEEFYNSEAPLGVAFDNNIELNRETGRMVRLNIFNKDNVSVITDVYDEQKGYPYIRVEGDVVEYSNDTDEKYIPVEECVHDTVLNIGKVLYDTPYFIGEYSNSIVYPYSFREKMRIGNFEKDYGLLYFIRSDDIHKGFEELQKTMKEMKMDDLYIHNYAKNAEDERNAALIVKVFAYGFIVLISLIAAANVFNTITTNINLRRREFAMLKSVGMTQKGMRKMLNYECILYGSKALIYGIPASAVITYLIYGAINKAIDTPFTMPWKAIGVAVLSVFLVVFVTMMYSMGKIKKDNTIDALKNENL